MVHYFLGRVYLEQRVYPEAIAELEKDIAVEPNVAYSYEDLGILYAQLNQPGKAEGYFHQGIEHNGTLVNSYFGLAKLYRESGRNREALEALDHAISLVPQSASLHFTRGQVLEKLGRSAEARNEFDLTARLHKLFNDRLQQGSSGDTAADAEAAAQE
jgi:tetratricopeptide (TPR) repeat protein